jgi:regulatory protein
VKLGHSKINITPIAALDKIKNWCAYQERSQNDARQKLYEYGMDAEHVNAIIAELITENYLNEERFAMAFTSGKFRIKHWGRGKIKMALRQHKVSDYCISKALKSIDENEYEKVLEKVLEKKIRLTKTGDKRKKFYAVLNYAVSKGFESDMVVQQLNVILGQQ